MDKKRGKYRFIRKRGRIIPIRIKENATNSDTLIGAGVIASSRRKVVKGRTFKTKIFKTPLFRVHSLSTKDRFFPRAVAITANNKKTKGTSIAFMTTLFQKKRKGIGKKLLASIQKDSMDRGRKSLSGLVISADGLKFSAREKSKFLVNGRSVDFRSANKAIKKGISTNVITKINPKNRSFANLRLKSTTRLSRSKLLLGSALLVAGLTRKRKRKNER